MSPQSLSPRIKAAEESIRAQVDMNACSLEEACATQLKHLSDLIRANTNITQEECTSVLEYLKDDKGSFSTEQRHEIGKLANMRCGAIVSRKPESSAGDDNQTNLFLHLYFPDWLWSVLLSDESMANKLAHIALFLVGLLTRVPQIAAITAKFD